MTLTADVWESLPGYMREADGRESGNPLATWLAGLTDLVEPTVALLDMDDPADPALTPPGLLAFTAALGGVDIEGVPAADLRAWMGGAPTRSRGSEAAIRERVGLTLTGARWVQIECPYLGDEFAMRITTRTAETPDSAATHAAAEMERPAWLTISFATAAGLTYDELSARYSTYDALTASGLTYDELAGGVVSEEGAGAGSRAWDRGESWYAANTGVPSGTSLTTTGATTYSTPNQAVVARDFTGHVNVSASGVTFTNCKFRLGINMNADCVLDHCEIIVPSNTAESVYMDQDGAAARFCNFHGGYEHLRIYGDNCSVEDSWFHGLQFTDGSGAIHADEIYCPGGESNNSILRCWMDADGALTPNSGEEISYALNMGGWLHTADHFEVIGNHFTRGSTGPYYLCGLGVGGGGTNSYVDNTWADGHNPYYPASLPDGDTWTNNLYEPSGNTVARP